MDSSGAWKAPVCDRNVMFYLLVKVFSSSGDLDVSTCLTSPPKKKKKNTLPWDQRVIPGVSEDSTSKVHSTARRLSWRFMAFWLKGELTLGLLLQPHTPSPDNFGLEFFHCSLGKITLSWITFPSNTCVRLTLIYFIPTSAEWSYIRLEIYWMQDNTVDFIT